MEKERRALIVATMAAASSIASVTFAEDDEAARAIAQPLFDDGVKLMEEGRCDDEAVTPDRRPKCREALAKFHKAFAIYPAGLGALRNAAFCERGLGMLASAMRDFREVARRAPLDPSPSKQLWAKHAAAEADKLGARVPHVVLEVAPPPPGLRVRVDERDIPAAAFGVPIPLDPGEHVIVAEAPGFLPFRHALEIEPKEDLRVAIHLAPVPPPPAKTAKVDAQPSYALPVVLGSAGVVAVGVGLGLGYAAKHARDESCTSGSPWRCRDAAHLDRARDYALASTITTAVGAALVVSGVVVLIAAGGKGREVAIVGSPGGAAVAGTF